MRRSLDLLLGSLMATKIALSLLVVSLGACAGLKSQALLQDLLNERGVEQALSALQLLSQGPVRLFDLLDVDLLGLKEGVSGRGGHTWFMECSHFITRAWHGGLCRSSLLRNQRWPRICGF